MKKEDLENINLIGGLVPLPKDKRDFRLSAIVELPDLKELPETFELEPVSIKNQYGSDFCTAMATCGMSELQEGVELEPSWSFAVSKMITGDVSVWGQNMRDAMKSHVKYGAIEKEWSPYSLENKDYIFLRYISNWPVELFEKAKKHKKRTFFKVDGQYDDFDNIRATIWLFRDRKRAVGIGLDWGWSLRTKIIETLSQKKVGHMVYAIGWKKIKDMTYLVIQNSYGKGAGDNGKHYVSREVINKMVKKYGSYVFVDEIERKEAEKLNWSIFRRIWEKIKKFFKKILWQHL